MLVSALVIGGIGPWLPFQMMALAWMGASSGALGLVTKRLPRRIEVGALAAFGWIWGFLYGAIVNLWFWPVAVGSGDLAWEPGLSLSETLTRYKTFYLATSLVWDAAGAIANAVLIALVAGALLESLRRFSGKLKPVVEFETPGLLGVPNDVGA